MTLLIISITISVIACLCILGIAIYNIVENDWSGWTISFTPIGMIFMLILLFGCFTKIKANEVGIIYDDRNGVLEEVKYEGFQSKSIYEHITKISTTNRTVNLTVSGQTKDSAFADFVITIVYKIEAKDAGRFFKATSADEIFS